MVFQLPKALTETSEAESEDGFEPESVFNATAPVDQESEKPSKSEISASFESSNSEVDLVQNASENSVKSKDLRQGSGSSRDCTEESNQNAEITIDNTNFVASSAEVTEENAEEKLVNVTRSLDIETGKLENYNKRTRI